MRIQQNVLQLLLLSTGLAPLVGCSGATDTSPPSVETGTASDALRYGDFSYADPAVGYFATGGYFCTATLIDPQVVLTAAHCVNYSTGPIAGTFSTQLSPSVNAVYPLDTAVSFGSEPGWPLSAEDIDNDVAIVRLEYPVPSSIATPLGLSGFAVLSIGSPVTIYGYGCRSTSGDAYSEHKQRYDTAFANQIYTCYGDSGGPFIMSLGSGPRVISLVTSGIVDYVPGDDQPAYGLVYSHAQAIANQLDVWNGRPPGSTNAGGGGGGNPPPCLSCRHEAF